MKSELPYWPAALNLKFAAAYCGLSTDTFKKVCPVRPIRFTKSTWGHRYLRQRLDEWLLSLDPNQPSVGAVSFGDFFEVPKRRFGERLGGSENEPRRRRKRGAVQSDV